MVMGRRVQLVVPCERLMPVHRSCKQLIVCGIMEPPLQVFQMYPSQVDFDCLVRYTLCNGGTEVTQCK